MTDYVLIFVGIVIGIIVSWVYGRLKNSPSTTQEETQEEVQKEEEVKQNFGTYVYSGGAYRAVRGEGGCNTKCSKSSIGWGNIKNDCDKYNGIYEKCGKKDIFGNYPGRRCKGYYNPPEDGAVCGAIEDRW